mmetsp:Transcript_21001/g.49770  ORF Transcript_21001/g.49770 Transcript_21001/m.49770 type:complete len:207 (+) Transcript_21001:155-775(+)
MPTPRSPARTRAGKDHPPRRLRSWRRRRSSTRSRPPSDRPFPEPCRRAENRGGPIGDRREPDCNPVSGTACSGPTFARRHHHRHRHRRAPMFPPGMSSSSRRRREPSNCRCKKEREVVMTVVVVAIADAGCFRDEPKTTTPVSSSSVPTMPSVRSIANARRSPKSRAWPATRWISLFLVQYSSLPLVRSDLLTVCCSLSTFVDLIR